MKLLVLLLETLVKLGQLGLDVVLDVLLLISDNLKDFVFKFGVSLLGKFV